MRMVRGSENGNDMRDMHELATREVARRNASVEAGAVPSRPALGVHAAASHLPEAFTREREGDCSSRCVAGEALMSLPHDIHRCRGFRAEDETLAASCVNCERRIDGIADYMRGARDILWMAPTQQEPCPEALLPKKIGARNA